jgi:hypothetical protein
MCVCMCRHGSFKSHPIESKFEMELQNNTERWNLTVIGLCSGVNKLCYSVSHVQLYCNIVDRVC